MASLMSRRPESLVPLDDDMEVTSDIERTHHHEEELIDIDLDDNFVHKNEDQNMVDDNLPDDEDDEMSDEPEPSMNRHEIDEELRDASEHGDADVDLPVEHEESAQEISIEDTDVQVRYDADPDDTSVHQYPEHEDPRPSTTEVDANGTSAHADLKVDSADAEAITAATVNNPHTGSDHTASQPAAEAHEDDFDFGPDYSDDEVEHPVEEDHDETSAALAETHGDSDVDDDDSRKVDFFPCPIVLYTDEDHFEYSEQILFPIKDGEHSTVFDSLSLYHQPLSDLLDQLHAKFFSEEDFSKQLVLRFDRLGLRIGKDNAAASTCCLENIVDVFARLLQNQGSEPNATLYIQVSAEIPFHQRFVQLRDASYAGKHFEEVALPDPYIAPEGVDVEGDVSEVYEDREHSETSEHVAGAPLPDDTGLATFDPQTHQPESLKVDEADTNPETTVQLCTASASQKESKATVNQRGIQSSEPQIDNEISENPVEPAFDTARGEEELDFRHQETAEGFNSQHHAVTISEDAGDDEAPKADVVETYAPADSLTRPETTATAHDQVHQNEEDYLELNFEDDASYGDGDSADPAQDSRPSIALASEAENEANQSSTSNGAEHGDMEDWLLDEHNAPSSRPDDVLTEDAQAQDAVKPSAGVSSDVPVALSTVPKQVAEDVDDLESLLSFGDDDHAVSVEAAAQRSTIEAGASTSDTKSDRHTVVASKRAHEEIEEDPGLALDTDFKKPRVD